jgi:hypothetical protein
MCHVVKAWHFYFMQVRKAMAHKSATQLKLSRGPNAGDPYCIQLFNSLFLIIHFSFLITPACIRPRSIHQRWS